MGLGSLACGGSPISPFEVELIPEEGNSLEELPPVARFRVKGLPQLELEAIWLVRGSVTQASLRRIQRQDPPQTVSKNRVPLLVWREADEIVLAPLVVLDDAEKWTVLALGFGEIARFSVSAEPIQILRRQGSGAIGRGGWTVHCQSLGDAPLTWSGPETIQGAGPHSGRLEVIPGWGPLGLQSERCVSVRALGAEGEFYLPPLSVGSALLEPLPIFERDLEANASPWCSEGDALSSCIRVQRAALELTLNPGAYVARVSTGSGAPPLEWEGELDAARTVVLGPLVPGTDYELRLVRLERGRFSSERIPFQSGAASERLILTEVMADPLGAEPDSEWIEMYNAGTAEARLDGYRITDGGGSSALPDVILKPGEWGVVVNERYRADPAVDLVPSASAIPLIVPRLGQGGLSNSGESISLFDPEGQLISHIPALRAAAGVSVARISLWSSDTPSSFARHDPPGASPGAPNQCSGPPLGVRQ